MSATWFKTFLANQGDCLVGGSYALWHFESFFKKSQPSWTPKDIDVFVAPQLETPISEESVRTHFFQLMKQCGTGCELKSIAFNRMYNAYWAVWDKSKKIPRDLDSSDILPGISYDFDKSILAVGTFSVPTKTMGKDDAFPAHQENVNVQVVLFDKQCDGHYSSPRPSMFQGLCGLADIGVFMSPQTQYSHRNTQPMAWYFCQDTFEKLFTSNTLVIWNDKRQAKYRERGYTIVDKQ